MRVLVVGAGAVGQFLAARLAHGGQDVTILAREAQAQAINHTGISVQNGPNTTRVGGLRAITAIADQALGAAFELVIIAVKSYSTSEVAAQLTGTTSLQAASFLSVQNGVGNEEILAEAFGAERVVAGALTVAVARVDNTSVTATGKGGLCFAPLGNSPHNWIMPVLSSSGLVVRAVNDWQSLKWSKLCINVLGNAVCAALDWMPAQVYADPIAFGIERDCLRETIAVMAALRITPLNLVNFPAALLVRSARTLPAPVLRMVLAGRVARARGTKLPSLLLDLRSQRRQSEVSVLNGAVALHAVKQGLPAPANTKLTEVVTGIAARTVDWNLVRGKPHVLREAIDRV